MTVASVFVAMNASRTIGGLAIGTQTILFVDVAEQRIRRAKMWGRAGWLIVATG